MAAQPGGRAGVLYGKLNVDWHRKQRESPPEKTLPFTQNASKRDFWVGGNGRNLPPLPLESHIKKFINAASYGDFHF